MASLEGDNLVVFYYLCSPEFSPDKMVLSLERVNLVVFYFQA
jgi:hypothetical protein